MPLRIPQRHFLTIAVVFLVLGSILADGLIMLFVIGMVLIIFLMIHWYILLIISADHRCYRFP